MIIPKLLLFLATISFTLESPVQIKSPERSDDKDHEKAKSNTLRLVTIVMRHGDRAPQDTYPNDPYVNNSMEPYGWGQLTNEGRRNQYNQGLFLRERYSHFLGPTYSPDIFYLQCTAVDRTKMSAMLEAAALWKPNEKQSFKPDLPWQPVTLFYQPRSEDTKHMKLTLPEWTNDYYPDKLIPLTLYDLQLNVYNDPLKRLKGGPFLKKIVIDMLAKKDNTLKPQERKMFMYIGHDSSIVSLLDVMHVWNNQIPNYNIMTMIELHEDSCGWNVQVFLRNTTEREPYRLTIPGCTTICPLEKFIHILKPMIPDNWEEECKVDGDYTLPPAPVP
ncbi:prostatic acid phosphatase isoform X3 [Osmia lignaria lignaria]|uniref:prostatic acid phosphatase isoform X3 n=1 Tax=Osmia lignaria lignaria TaxID=1437193 RepID=UPI0014792BB8|nr:prostatic acid phosphatase-like isoform X3 [Osmia lignaria]